MVEWITYGVTFRIVWAIALAWVIFACHNGWGGKSQIIQIMSGKKILVALLPTVKKYFAGIFHLRIASRGIFRILVDVYDRVENLHHRYLTGS